MVGIARKLLLASSQAYKNTDNGTPLKTNAGYDQIGWLAVPKTFFGGVGDIDCVIIGETATEIIIAFRGTTPTDSTDEPQKLIDWLNSLDHTMTKTPVYDPQVGVNDGMFKSVTNVWNELKTELIKRMTASPGKLVYITGHSKGGAMAHLAILRFMTDVETKKLFENKNEPRIATFAAPKPGDAEFKTLYNSEVHHSVRYENNLDIVPLYPFDSTFRDDLSGLDPLKDIIAVLGDGDSADPFVAVGDLLFINQNKKIVPDNPPRLLLSRYADIAHKIGTLNLGLIFDAHTLINCQYPEQGYAAVINDTFPNPNSFESGGGVASV